MECPYCGVEIEPNGCWLISDTDGDGKLNCPHCGGVCEVDHECMPDIEFGDGDSAPGCIETIRKPDAAKPDNAD